MDGDTDLRTPPRSGRAKRLISDNWTLLVGIIVVGLLLASSSWDWNYWSEFTFDQNHELKELKTDRPRIIQQLLLIVGGIAAFFLASWRTWTAHKQANAALEQVRVALRQADLAERAHNVDRYAKAAAMLDSEKTAVRQAGVFALFELGRADTANSYISVIKLLAGFARARSAELRNTHPKETAAKGSPDLCDAVQSIGWLRNQRPDEVEGERTARFELNLSEVIVTSTLLNEVDFSLVSLRVSDLEDSEFRLAKFWQAEFYGASLIGVRAQWSDFSNAILEDTKLQDAQFDSCSFERAVLVAAEFEHTRLIDCNISGANFVGAIGLTSEAIKRSWAWKDDPPELPSNVDFDNYVDSGRNGVHRENYRKEREYQKGHSRPS